MIKPNRVAGSGHYSHDVPTTPGLVVHMRDAAHHGTHIWLDESSGSRRYLWLADDTDQSGSSDRIILIRNPDIDRRDNVVAVDLDSRDGLAFVEYDANAEPDIGEAEIVVWDSHGIDGRHHDDLVALVSSLIPTIGDEYRAPEGTLDDEPSMQLTVGFSADGSEYGYQTGDNSYTGGAYGFPHWAVVTLTRDSRPDEIAREIIDQAEGVMNE